MTQQTLGGRIAALRKEKGMTQLELAQQMGVTDKAVSKWERDLACPDIQTLPRLAQLFGITVDELMQGAAPGQGQLPKEGPSLFPLACKAICLAMGVAVAVLSVLGQLDTRSGFCLLASPKPGQTKTGAIPLPALDRPCFLFCFPAFLS